MMHQTMTFQKEEIVLSTRYKIPLQNSYSDGDMGAKNDKAKDGKK